MTAARAAQYAQLSLGRVADSQKAGQLAEYSLGLATSALRHIVADLQELAKKEVKS